MKQESAEQVGTSQGQATTNVVVIGGGVIGLSVAEQLSHEGLAVTLLEKDRIAAGASYGNAAGFAFSEIMPMASPETIRKSIKWFLDPLGPFAVVPRDLPLTLGWLLRFCFAARNAQFDRSIEVQAALMRLGESTLAQTLSRTGLGSMVRSNGALYLYESEAQYRADLKNWHSRERHGIQFECYEGGTLHEFQPGLSRSIAAGIFTPAFQSVSNPYDYCRALHNHVESNGVITRYDQAISVLPNGNGCVVTLENDESIHADKVVVAAGPWSAELSSKLGDTVPVVGERGYNTTLPKTSLRNLDRTLFFTAHGFVLTPLADGIRVGGASEIAKLDRAPNFKRSKAMLAKAKSLIPDLQTEGGEEWMGIRPTIPDTLPVISRATKSSNVIYAFGHGHLGLTQSTATAQLVSDLCSGRKPSVDLTALRVNRF
ncbi:MAG: NAD(P)/FAD-dependent oxidoreductase [Gammaproteobacteria bacterium]